MKFTKKAFAMFLIFILEISLFGNAVTTNAKTMKPGMQKKVSVRVSQSMTLKIKNVSKTKIKGTTWRVSDKKKLKLTKKKRDSVRITGQKTGTVKVTASMTVGKKKYKLSSKVTIVNAKTEKPPVATTPGSSQISPTNVPSSAVPSTKPTEPAPPVQTVTPAPEKTPRPTPPGTAQSIKQMETLPEAKSYQRSAVPPALLTMLDGTEVTTPEQWEQRRQEIRCILQRYMYGIWQDGSEETLRYDISDDRITITIQKDGQEVSFQATCSMPEGPAPEEGWPVIVSVGWIDSSFINANDCATISFTPTDIASDNKERDGIFYTLYPYNISDWRKQTGGVMAWAWGTSKIMDALEQGAGKQLGISPEHAIVTGVSRYGKAAAAAGAFDERFAVSMPVCSGYGGLTMGRYSSNNRTYNLLPDFENDPKKSDVTDLSAWSSTGGNEPITSLRAAGWFNEEFNSFSTYRHLPFDSHFIAALSATDDRYLFIITGINSDMWSSPPGFWWCYQEAKPAFDLMGLEDHLAIQMHLNLHGIETVDLCKLFTFTNHHFYHKTTDPAGFPEPWNELLKNFTLDGLKTCVFASEANAEAYESGKPQTD